MSAAFRNPAIVQQFLSAPMTEFRNDEENLSAAACMDYTSPTTARMSEP